MDFYLPTQEIIKFYQIAPRISAMRNNGVTQVISKHLISLSSQLSESKINTIVGLLACAFSIYTPKMQLFNFSELLEGAGSFTFYPQVMAALTKQSLSNISEQMLAKTETNLETSVPGLKNIVSAGASLLPSLIEFLTRQSNINQIWTDLNLQFENIEVKPHYFVNCMKQNPRNIPEEAAGYILLGDSIDQIMKKINKGFCEEGNTEYNPVLDNVQIILSMLGSIKINEAEFQSFEIVKQQFKDKVISPKALKDAVSEGFKKFWIEDQEITDLANQLLKKK